MKRPFLFFLLIGLAFPAWGAVQTQTVEYRDGKAPLEGFFAVDDAIPGKRPGILVVHEWKGLNDYAKRRARELAELGYAAFAVDMYGKGIRAKDHEAAAKLSGVYREDRALMRQRIGAALDWLKERPEVDPDRIAAIGYCFGGTTVLELARSGADVKGVVSFHGGLDTPQPEETANVLAKVLVLHGADDKFISPEQVTAFEQEMKERRVDYHLIQYPGAVHSFTVPEAGSDPSAGMAYNEAADRASWEEMKAFLAGLLGSAQEKT